MKGEKKVKTLKLDFFPFSGMRNTRFCNESADIPTSRLIGTPFLDAFPNSGNVIFGTVAFRLIER